MPMGPTMQDPINSDSDAHEFDDDIRDILDRLEAWRGSVRIVAHNMRKELKAGRVDARHQNSVRAQIKRAELMGRRLRIAVMAVDGVLDDY